MGPFLRHRVLQHNVKQIANAAARVTSMGGLNGHIPNLELHSFRDASSLNMVNVFTDQGIGGFSTATIDVEQSPSEELCWSSRRNSSPQYGRFRGNISIALPRDRPKVGRTGFAAWRTNDPTWSVFGKSVFNCEGHAFLALRVKCDEGRYFVNLQSNAVVATDLYQHRLFARTPGHWENVYIPFSQFVKTHFGEVLNQQGNIPKNSFTTVGLGLIDRIPGPFEICVDRIWATNERDIY